MDDRCVTVQSVLGEMLYFSNSGYEHERDHFLQPFAQPKHGADKGYAAESLQAFSVCARTDYALRSGLAVPTRFLPQGA